MNGILYLNKKIAQKPIDLVHMLKSYDFLHDQKIGYAGRLDPMASGRMLMMIGNTCKNRDKLQNKDKTYRFKILHGITTDTYDPMGLITEIDFQSTIDLDSIDYSKFIGKQMQEYPPYSSYHIDGEPLFKLAKEGRLPADMPRKQIEVYDLKYLETKKIDLRDWIKEQVNYISKVKGDFRQAEIIARWQKVENEYQGQKVQVSEFITSVSSGTYVRILGREICKNCLIYGIMKYKFPKKEYESKPST